MTLFAEDPAGPVDKTFKHLQSVSTTSRLYQIEKLRAYGVGELVALPQLIVCGDQSAGKSSVLEGITGIPFPRQEGLCTRFPTEIILKHVEGNATEITASIRPHTLRSAEIQQTLASYRKVVGDMSELPSIIQEVSRLMNIKGYSDNGDGFSFAPDALRIEISGPIGLHLSIVDLPGLISVSDEEDDVKAVRDMVTSYLQSPRTIILAVLQAGNDVENQLIIKLARKLDSKGQRTVGIITKPDLINVGAEQGIALVAKNQGSVTLKLGFFLLKNPSPAELEEGLSMDTRSERELGFFSNPVWRDQGLDPERVGAEKLRVFLQDLLDTHIERELPKVRDEIRRCLKSTETDLKSLGLARPTMPHIRSYLTGLSMRFFELIQAALDGNYHSIDADFFAPDTSRLRAAIQKSNTKFAAHMRQHGQTRKIGQEAETSSDSASESDTPDHDEDEPEDGNAPSVVSKFEMMRWVRQVYSRTRGRELPGNHNSALLAELFNEQSRLWPTVAEAHVHKILGIVSQWIRMAMEKVIPEAAVREQVQTILQAWLEQAEQAASSELEKLVEDERRGPLTYNHYFTDNVQKAQKAAVRQALQNVANVDRNGKLHISNVPADILKFNEALESRITVDMDARACQEAFTQLNAYYKVAMKTFVDNVARQVIERHIVSPFPQAFCPNYVSQLSDEALTQIGSEPESQVLQREKLTKQADGLRKSLRDIHVNL